MTDKLTAADVLCIVADAVWKPREGATTVYGEEATLAGIAHRLRDEAARREAVETKRTCGPEVFDAALKSLAASVADAPPPPADDLCARQPVYEDLPSYLRKLALARNSGITLAAERAPEWKAAAAIEALRAERDAVLSLIPTRFLDPPDGGEVKPVELVRRVVDRVAALEDDMRDIAEYWNGSRTDEAMSNALDHIIEVAGKNLAAGGGNG